MNVGDPELEYALYEAEHRVREIQASCTDGRVMILIAGSMICSTLSAILRS